MGRTDNRYSSHFQILKLASFRKRRAGFVSYSWPFLLILRRRRSRCRRLLCFARLYPCFRQSDCPCIRDYMFSRYLQYPLMDFRQIFVIAAVSWDKSELIRFRGQKVKSQGHIIAAEASSTRRYAYSAVFATATCLSIRLSVRHSPVVCLAERKQDCEMYTI